MLNKKRQIILCALFCLLLSQSVLAAIQLEVEFPKIGSQELTGDSTLEETIKYVFNLAIAGIALIILFSLVRGGIVYLGSAGDPGKMADARKKIFGSALGLLIVFSSYLLLRTLNPELLILKIEKKPVVAGVILLNSAALDPGNANYNADIIQTLTNGSEEEIAKTLQELLDAPSTSPRAVYVYQSVRDFRVMFGKFVLGDLLGIAQGNLDILHLYDERTTHNYPGTNEQEFNGRQVFNFENFQLAGIYFLPGTNAKVSTYHNADFSHDKGLSLQNFEWEMPDELAVAPADYQYVAPDCSIGSGPCMLNLLIEGVEISGHDDIKTAPLSLKIEYLGRGVYLHSKKLGQEIYLQDSVEFLRDLPYNFDDKTEKIEIRNWLDEKNDENNVESVRKTNYLAILHEQEGFKGGLRLFFEPFILPLKDIGSSDTFIGSLPQENPATPVNDVQIKLNNQPYLFGRINKPSSIQIFEIEDQKQITCEIILCDDVGLKGGCYAYLLNLNEPSQQAKDSISDDDFVGFTDNIDRFLVYPRTLIGAPDDADVPDEVKKAANPDLSLYENFRSLKIIGDCIVVFFEKYQDESKWRDCLNQINNSCAMSGEHSEVFTPWSEEHQNNNGYLDLTEDNKFYEHPINRCGCIFEEVFGHRLVIRHCRPCARSIAVFPVKNPNEKY